jgi:hypothetical protein
VDKQDAHLLVTKNTWGLPAYLPRKAAWNKKGRDG